jgi:hypothetical protein
MKLRSRGSVALCLVALGTSLSLPCACQTNDKIDECRVSGFSDDHSGNRTSIRTGTFSVGTLQSSAQLFRPLSTSSATPPILFSHSSITVGEHQTDLYKLAQQLAKRGAAVLVLERTIRWEPRDNAANREGPLVTCAFNWLIKQPSMNLTHVVYLGPRLLLKGGVLDTPLTILEPRATSYAVFWIPTAETEGTDYTDKLTSPVGRDWVTTRIDKYLHTNELVKK